MSKKANSEELYYDDPADYKKKDNRKINHNHRDERKKKELSRNAVMMKPD